MVAVNPFALFRESCRQALMNSLNKLFPEVTVSSTLELPPNPEFGELSSSACFELAKQLKKKPLSLAKQVAESIDLESYPLIREVGAVGGYVNFYVRLDEFSRLTIESAKALNAEYGLVKTEKPLKIIVEHTSVNPIHPINVGQARNPVLGDCIAKLLKVRGHDVSRHYYVDDVGRQTAVIAYGYELLGKPKPEGKPDHLIGKIYAVTSCILEVQRLKKEIERGRREQTANQEDMQKLQKDLDGWTSIAIDLEAANPQLFKQLLDKISQDAYAEEKVAELNRGYEKGVKEAEELIREVSELCLGGFKQTLSRVGIAYDSWDWESDLVWNSSVKKTLAELEKTPYVFRAGQVLEFDADKVASDLDLKKAFGLSEDHEVPSLTLVRADGTTLYTTRDIPYNLWKFTQAERLINVVGMEQTLPQLQLKLALCALGHLNEAKNLVHFAYNLVSLPGYKMSSRRGRYITLDETVDEAVKRAFEEVEKRSPQFRMEEKTRISELVGIGAIKYALVQVDPSKPVVFTWDRVLDFEKNSAPYIQYSHARAGSILRKIGRKTFQPDYSLLTEAVERSLILLLARFSEVFIEAVDNLRPDEVAEFANSLADKFNSFYNACPVIKAEPQGLSDARLALVDAVRIVLRNALTLLGIEAPERM